MAYSEKIRDYKFELFKHRSKNWKLLFSFAVAVAAMVGFYFYGETSSEMDNPEAFQIGLGLGLLFILTGFLTGRSKSYRKTWDGVVIDKVKKHTSKDIGYDHIKAERIIYKVIIQADDGTSHEISSEDDDTLYNYFEVGDKVRHHGKLNTYEKFDKSHDEIVFCNACGIRHKINEVNCRNCGCPLLK